MDVEDKGVSSVHCEGDASDSGLEETQRVFLQRVEVEFSNPYGEIVDAVVDGGELLVGLEDLFKFSKPGCKVCSGVGWYRNAAAKPGEKDTQLCVCCQRRLISGLPNGVKLLTRTVKPFGDLPERE